MFYCVMLFWTLLLFCTNDYKKINYKIKLYTFFKYCAGNLI